MNKQRSRRLIVVLAHCATALALASCAAVPDADNPAAAEELNFGVMVMAHGGSEEWNSHLAAAVEPLRQRYPVAMALGMADAGSIEAATRELESRGVTDVGVVRVFISGESWYDRTLQILGLREGAPPRRGGSPQRPLDAAGARPMPMGFWRIDTNLAFHVSIEGLADAPEVDEILASRIRGLSSNPENEVVALIAHGPGDDTENARWLDKITLRSKHADEQLGLREIRVFTLREDWPEKRREAEREIRAYIEQTNSRDLTPIVVPFRLQGFGPYQDILGTLSYRADGLGLLPHTNVAQWISRQADQLRTAAVSQQQQQSGEAGAADE